MLSPDEIRALVARYVDMMCHSDIDGIMALYAEDAVAEDPVGGNIHQGKEAIRQFYAEVAPALHVELKGPVCVAANNCAFLLLARHDFDNHSSYLDATDVFSFDEQGKIINMKAFWNMADVRDKP
jgi:steroid delta-isomerase